MAFIRLLVRDCCGDQADQRQALSNHLLTTQGIPPNGYATLDMPVISGWRYYDDSNTQKDHLVRDMVVSEWNGNFTDYALVEVDSSVIAADGTLIGRIEIDVRCRDLCNNLKNKGFWQIEGNALMPYRKKGTAYFSTDCGYTSALGSVHSWGILEGETATIVAEGGRGSNRHFYTDNNNVKAETSSGGTFPVNGYNGGRQGLDPDIEFVNENFALRLQQAGFPILMEKNLKLEELPSIKIKGIRPGLSFITCTDGISCTWGMFLQVECNFCTGDTEGEEATGEIEAHPSTAKRSHDNSIITDGGKEWCACDSLEESTSNFDINVLGSFDPVSTDTFRNTYVLGGGLIAGEGAPTVSGNLYFKKAGLGGRHTMVNCPKNVRMEVGESVTIDLPDNFLKDGEGNTITWGYKILTVPPVPSENDDPLETWGAGWGFGNTGPMAGFSNDDSLLWSITKTKTSITLEAIAPTNYLPSVIMLYRKSGGLTRRSGEQYIGAPSLSSLHKVSISSTAGTGSSWPVRIWEQIAVGGTGIVGTQYINIERDDTSSARSTSCALFFTANSFCPEAEWKFEDLGDKLRARLTVQTDKGQLRLFSPIDNEENNIFDDSNNYVQATLEGDDFVEKDIVLYEDPNPLGPPKELIQGGSIFGIWSPYASNRIDNRHPYYNVTDLNRGLIDDNSEFFEVKVTSDGKTIGLLGPKHESGDLLEDIEGDFKDKWFGLYEPLRGCMCSWGSSFKIEKGSATAIEADNELFVLAENKDKNRADKD